MLLGIDLGTSSIKVSVLDPATGKCVRSVTAPSEELPRYAPNPGWTEQDPEDWWNATVEAVQALGPDLAASITAIGIGYQMHGLVLVDSDFVPARRSIIWSDGRATEVGKAAQAKLTPSVRDSLLNDLGNFTLSKLAWVVQHDPSAVEKSAYALLPGDYVAAKLSGRATTTSTGLSEMMAWDHVGRKPSDAAWEACGPLRLRPEVVSIFGPQSEVSSSAAALTGLREGTPITYRAGDQPNNAFSLGVAAPGMLAAVAGTSGVVYGVSGEASRDPHSRVNSFVHVTDQPDAQRIGILMCVNGAGSSYSWLKKVTGGSFEAMNALAVSAQPGADGIRIFPFGNGAERILQNLIVGAQIHGLDYTMHGLGHLARATMEGVAFAMRYGYDVMAELGAGAKVVRAGQASMFTSELFCQIFADVFQAELQLLDTDGSLGAARAAGVGSGRFASIEDSLAGLDVIRTFRPDSSSPYADLYQDWRTKLGSILQDRS